MGNILTAIHNIHNIHTLEIEELTFGNNRATNLGDGLEQFVKDCFSTTIGDMDEQQRLLRYNAVFSYEGSKTRAPDLMLRGGDAIEVKKTESIQSELQLNSSHPKHKLHSSSTLINQHCRTCEEWEEKDIIYAVGHVKSKQLSSLWLAYGSIYAADEDVYTDLKSSITDSITNTPNVNFSPTNELGRVNYVDPLKITNMRIRGMWLLKPPVSVFDYLYTYNPSLKFQLVAIIPLDKYNSFDVASRNLIESNVDEVLKITDVQVRNPNNPMDLIDAKLITIQQS